MLMEIKKHAEELYNLALDPTRREEYEKIKKIEVIKGEPIWRITFNSLQTLARIMLFYIINDLEYAQKLADAKSEVYTKLSNRLFKELAEAIKREREGDRDAKEEVKKSICEAVLSSLLRNIWKEAIITGITSREREPP